MTSDLTAFQEPHHQTLELRSVQALASGDVAAAFRWSDRRCRIPPLAGPHCYVLRGDALFRLGNKVAALADIEYALEIAPDDLAANRRMLAWGDGHRQLEAAGILIARDHDDRSLRKAIAVLRGERRRAFASARIVGDCVRGWAAWKAPGAVQIVIAGVAHAISARAHPSHPLAEALGEAAEFSVPILPSERSQQVTVEYEGETLLSIWTPEPAADGVTTEASTKGLSSSRIRRRRGRVASDPSVTIIVPVYADYEATKVCIERLLEQSSNSGLSKVVVINDATPDSRIREYLAELGESRRIQLLINERNLGFVGSVNRGLALATEGDVLLLNADTIAPDGFVERLAAAARSSPQVGTVTPLSNNGEFTSFPIRNVQNSLPATDEILAIDGVAANVNAGQAIDIPNGIGFCLYITRGCLNAVGKLSNDYDRGYLEEVDFCLRASALGFRHVCAPSVYVGHHGSRSFGNEKRSLVVRNLSVLEQKFPKYRKECAAFIAIDPLRAARQAIELKAPLLDRKPQVLVTGEGAVAAVTQHYARNLVSEGQAALILTMKRRPAGVTATISDAAGQAPQSIAFDLAAQGEVKTLFAYLREVKPSRIGLFDPSNIPPVVFEGLRELKLPHDVFVADAGLFGDQDAPSLGVLADRQIDLAENQAAIASKTVRQTDNRSYTLSKMVRQAERLLAPCRHAEAFAKGHIATCDAARLVNVGNQYPARRLENDGVRLRRPSRRRLGIIPIRSCAQEQTLMAKIAGGLATRCPEASLVVIGSTLNDLGLMHFGNVFVTGPVDVSEMEHICHSYDLGALLVCIARPLFGHPLQFFAHSSGLPCAYFGWSACHAERSEDLVLDSRAPIEVLLGVLTRWMMRD
jgi:GT2 family glycosyltransferase